MPRFRARTRETDDRELAVLLADQALLEILVLARQARRSPQDVPVAEIMGRIGDLADFCRDMRGVAASYRRRPRHAAPTTGRSGRCASGR